MSIKSKTAKYDNNMKNNINKNNDIVTFMIITMTLIIIMITVTIMIV